MNPPPVSLIDASTLLEEIGGDRELLGNLIQTALHDLPLNMAALKVSAERYELVKMSHIAHKMKTVLAHWLAESAREEAMKVERAANEGAIDEAIEATERLEIKLAGVLQALAQYEV
jgi:HPt (histidine-containing phosphotransfer) domain-containing protein